MRAQLIFLLFVLFSLFSTYCYCKKFESDHLYSLSEKNAYTAVKNSTVPVFIFLYIPFSWINLTQMINLIHGSYVPNCDFCKELAPTWIALAEKQKEQTLVAVVDCSDNSVLCKYWNVTEVPTLFL